MVVWLMGGGGGGGGLCRAINCTQVCAALNCFGVKGEHARPG